MSNEYVRFASLLSTGLLPDVGVRAVLASCSSQFASRLTAYAAGSAGPSLHAELLASKHLPAAAAAHLVKRVDAGLVTKVLRSERRDSVLAEALGRCTSVPVPLQRRVSKVQLGGHSQAVFARLPGMDPLAALQFLERDLSRVRDFGDVLWVAGHSGEWERLADVCVDAATLSHPMVVEGVVAVFDELRSVLIERFAAGRSLRLLPVVAAHVSDTQRGQLVDVLVSKFSSGVSEVPFVRAAAVLCDDLRTPQAVRARVWDLPGVRPSFVFLGVPTPDLFPCAVTVDELSVRDVDVLLARPACTPWDVSRLSQLLWLSSVHLGEWQALRLAASVTEVVVPHRVSSRMSLVWLSPALPLLQTANHSTCQAVGQLVAAASERADQWAASSVTVTDRVVLRDTSSVSGSGSGSSAQQVPVDGPIPVGTSAAGWSGGAALLVERFGSSELMWQFAARLLPRFTGSFSEFADVVVATTRSH